MATDFLSGDAGQRVLQRAVSVLEAYASNTRDPMLQQLIEALRIIKSNAKSFDQAAQFTVQASAGDFTDIVEQLGSSPTHQSHFVSRLYIWTFRLVFERQLMLKPGDDLTPELLRFLNLPREEPAAFDEETRMQIDRIERSFPTILLRDMLGHEDFSKLRNIGRYSKEIEGRIANWDVALKAKEDRASTLEQSLSKYVKGFNFVGLHQGFDDLATDKRSELRRARWATWITGAAALLPVIGEIAVIYWHLPTIESVKWGLLASAVPVVTLTLLLLYFFRLNVRAADGVKSQLLQIELRKTLCRFIQDYASYAKQLKEDGAEPLAKFENIVFSGIVSSDEKIPATFDGLDQLSGLIKTVKG